MTGGEPGSLAVRYQQALSSYVKDPSEPGRSEAYELGRTAVTASLSLLDFAALHHQAVETALSQDLDEEGRRVATEFFLEALSTFDMAQRGYLEAQERARSEREHAEKLRGLNEAVVAITAVESFSERLANATKFSARMVCAEGSGVLLDGEPGSTPTDRLPADVYTLARRAATKRSTQVAALRQGPDAQWAVAVPIGDGSDVVRGSLVLWRPEAFHADEVALIEQFARYASMALDMSARFEREHELAITLQHAMLPPAPPDVPGLEVAWRYRPAQARDIGGDWYDVFNVDNGDVVLVVGDVMGHDLRAAAIMGQLRLALQAYAIDGYPPSEVVDRADRLLHRLDPTLLATLAYGVLDRDRRRLVLSNAGHPPPLLIDSAGEPTPLMGALSVPLGTDVSHARHRQFGYDIEPGSRLLFYTDGLVEDRRRGFDEGLSQLISSLRGALRSPEEVCDVALSVRGEYRMDDVCVLCAAVVS